MAAAVEDVRTERLWLVRPDGPASPGEPTQVIFLVRGKTADPDSFTTCAVPSVPFAVLLGHLTAERRAADLTDC
jgi:hypothetical protein